MLFSFVFFFFSSRRRHTRYIGDWSSDVCSSDLEQPVVSVALSFRAGAIYDPPGKEGLSDLVAELLTKGSETRSADQIEIGRASCRERGESWGVAGGVKRET